MGQPVKKIISDNNKIKEDSFITLLIDGNSLLFSSFADTKVNTKGVHYGGVFQFLLQMKMQLDKRDFDYIYCFFDNEYSGWLRWEIYNQYKANRDKHYSQYGISDYMKDFNATLSSMQSHIFGKKEDKNDSKKDFIDLNFDRERDILCEMFNELYVRWNIDDITEGDDMIAYYVKNKKENEKILIISSDMDLTQLLSDDVMIYNQKLKKYITTKNFKETFGYHYENTLVKKILCGDTSDNIGNIKLLSEDAFDKLMPEYKVKKITVDDVKARAQELIDERIASKKKPLSVHTNIINGISNKKYDGDFYEINERLINLKEPLLSDEAIEEMDNMMYAPMDISDRSFKNLYRIILREGIDELTSDTSFASFFRPFKKIEEKEIKRFESSK